MPFKIGDFFAIFPVWFHVLPIWSSTDWCSIHIVLTFAVLTFCDEIKLLFEFFRNFRITFRNFFHTNVFQPIRTNPFSFDIYGRMTVGQLSSNCFLKWISMSIFFKNSDFLVFLIKHCSKKSRLSPKIAIHVSPHFNQITVINLKTLLTWKYVY